MCVVEDPGDVNYRIGRTTPRKTALPLAEIAKFPAFPRRIADARCENDEQGEVLPRGNRPCCRESDAVPLQASERRRAMASTIFCESALMTLLPVNDLAVAIEHGFTSFECANGMPSSALEKPAAE